MKKATKARPALRASRSRLASAPAAARRRAPADSDADGLMAPLYGALARILRTGVLISAAIIAVGLVLYLVEGVSGYRHGAYPRTLGAELAGLAVGRPYAVIGLGLLILAATPVVRVGAEVVWFVRRGFWPFIVLSAFTLVMLLCSFALGRHL